MKVIHAAMTVVFTVVVLALTGCGRANALAVTPPDLSDVDAKAVFAKLTANEQLAAAAGQLAEVLEVEPELVRARLQPSGCTLCGSESNQEGASVKGLEVAAAADALAAGDGVYLFVGQFTCFYKFDGSLLTPQSCQLAPL
jgi:hypothetical protein